MNPIDLVVEDVLSEAVLRKTIAFANTSLPVRACDVRGGAENIRKQIGAFNASAAFRPVVVLTDLDALSCPIELTARWFSGIVRHPSLLFRVCVRAVESWVIADREMLASFLSVQANQIPSYPDQLSNPKLELINIARMSPNSRLRRAIVPRGVSAKVGSGYNDVLEDFVRSKWRPNIAMKNSESLERAIRALSELSA